MRKILVVAMSSAAVAIGVVGTALAADPVPAASPITRTVLNRGDVPGSNYEVVLVKVEVAANGHVARHTHPGTVFGYLIEGDYSISISGAPYQHLAPGSTFTIPSGAVHVEQAGAAGAKILAVFTVEKGKPLTTPAP